MPIISIILPSYNHASFLKDRLDSIVNQTFEDWELIILDDCSTDESVEILKDFVALNKNKIAQFIVNKKNSGSGYTSWKKGIELATSKYIWIAETDDYSDLHFLEEQIKVLELNENCTLSFSASNYVDKKNKFLLNTDKRTQDLNVSKGNTKIFKEKIFVDRMPFETYIPNGSSVVFRKPIQSIPEEIFINRQCSDIFLWTFLLQNSSFAFINKKLNFFRRHENSTTTKISNSKDLMGTYKEIVFYLYFFNLEDKNNKFIEHYFHNYIWKNKIDIFNLSIFNNNKQLKKVYLKKLFLLTFNMVFNGK